MSIKQEAIWAAAPSTTRGSPTIISTDSKGERIVYASNKSIFVRSIDDPSVAVQYTGHTAQTTVARFAPSGFYVASGDVSGSVRIWDPKNVDNTRGEYHIIAGRINDIAWDGDSQRIIAVGDGKERFGHCITADSGNTVGEISGHSSQINSVSIRQQRPIRAATGSDDTTMVFYNGPPFKFATSARGKHDKYIYGTQFSPDGSYLVTVGADKKIWLYDGKTGEPVKQVGNGEHTGSIFGVSWAPDSKRFVTCSGDQTVKIWNIDGLVKSWRAGTAVSDQQVGVVWARSDLIISLGLGGDLIYWREDSDKPVRVVRGHMKAITAAAASKTLWTGSTDGQIRAWDLSTGLAEEVDGGSSSYVSGLAVSNGRVSSVSWDDTIRTIDESHKSFTGVSAKSNGQPKAVAVAGSKTVVATTNGVDVYSDGQLTSHKLDTVTAIAAHGSVVVTGSDRAVSFYKLPDMKLINQLDSASISTLAFSSTGTHVAAGTTMGKILVYSTAGSEWKLETSRWSAHTARVTGISWSPDGSRAVSGSLDTNVHIWSLKDPGKRIKAANAHKEGVGAVVWIDEKKVVSCGADAAVKVWSVE